MQLKKKFKMRYLMTFTSKELTSKLVEYFPDEKIVTIG